MPTSSQRAHGNPPRKTNNPFPQLQLFLPYKIWGEGRCKVTSRHPASSMLPELFWPDPRGLMGSSSFMKRPRQNQIDNMLVSVYKLPFCVNLHLLKSPLKKHTHTQQKTHPVVIDSLYITQTGKERQALSKWKFMG